MDKPKIVNRAILTQRVINVLWGTYQKLLASGKVAESRGVETAINDFIENIEKYH